MPCNPCRKRDRLAATIRDWLWNRLFFFLIRSQGINTLDFIGLNYYTRTLVRSTGWGVGMVLGRACHELHHREQGPFSDIGWEVYPFGLQAILEQFAKFGLPIIITENGIATNDETLRRDFLRQHVQSLATALHNGIQVIGYLYWTLVDNYEWNLGMTARFGLAALDVYTQQRLSRPCVYDFQQLGAEITALAGKSNAIIPGE
jgi:beta-glucosidase/6-phospho-beta-glucosidase/beta-galactosidase